MSTETANAATDEIGTLIERARRAQQSIEDFSQAQVDRLTTAVAWSVVRQDRAETLAKLAVDEGGFGNYADKVSKIRNRIMGTLADIKDVKTVGVVEEIPEKGLIKIAKPVGVVAALIPTTGPDATPPLKTLLALKGRNAIIIAAHPRTQHDCVAIFCETFWDLQVTKRSPKLATSDCLRRPGRPRSSGPDPTRGPDTARR
jgi:sulfoacetaldehyde dehydrogenase